MNFLTYYSWLKTTFTAPSRIFNNRILVIGYQGRPSIFIKSSLTYKTFSWFIGPTNNLIKLFNFFNGFYFILVLTIFFIYYFNFFSFSKLIFLTWFVFDFIFFILLQFKYLVISFLTSLTVRLLSFLSPYKVFKTTDFFFTPYKEFPNFFYNTPKPGSWDSFFNAQEVNRLGYTFQTNRTVFFKIYYLIKTLPLLNYFKHIYFFSFFNTPTGADFFNYKSFDLFKFNNHAKSYPTSLLKLSKTPQNLFSTFFITNNILTNTSSSASLSLFKNIKWLLISNNGCTSFNLLSEDSQTDLQKSWWVFKYLNYLKLTSAFYKLPKHFNPNYTLFTNKNSNYSPFLIPYYYTNTAFLYNLNDATVVFFQKNLNFNVSASSLLHSEVTDSLFFYSNFIEVLFYKNLFFFNKKKLFFEVKGGNFSGFLRLL